MRKRKNKFEPLKPHVAKNNIVIVRIPHGTPIEKANEAKKKSFQLANNLRENWYSW